MKEELREPGVDYFEELKKKSPLVDIEVVLIDLILLDEGQEKLEQEQRINYLSESLCARRFFSSRTECQDMAELFLRIKRRQPFVNMHRMHEFIRKLRQYEHQKRQDIFSLFPAEELQEPKKLPLTSEELKKLGIERWRVYLARTKVLTKILWGFLVFLDLVVLVIWIGDVLRAFETMTWVYWIVGSISMVVIVFLIHFGADYAKRTGKWENLPIFLAVPLCFAANWKVAIVVVFATAIAHFEYSQELIYKTKVLQLKKLHKQ